MKLRNVFLFLCCCVVCVSCENNSSEIINNDTSTSARSVAGGYYLDGADNLYTGAPEKYTLKKVGNTPLDGVYVTNWNYSSDLYRVTSDNLSITLGRKLALGEYTISASLSNGESVSKRIIAIDSDSKPDGSVDKIASSLFIRPIGVSKDINGPYANIDDYRYGMGQSYNMVNGDDLSFKCKIENITSSSIWVNLGMITFAYGNSSEKYTPKSIVYENLNAVPSSVSIEGNSSVPVVFYLGYEWSRYILPNKVTVFKPYYSYYNISSVGCGYLLTR